MDISEARRNSSTSTNSNTKYQRCSKDGCGSVLSPHSRSTVCDQCLQKYTRYRATDVPYPAMMGESSAPVQVRSNFSDRLDITSANPYGPFNVRLRILVSRIPLIAKNRLSYHTCSKTDIFLVIEYVISAACNTALLMIRFIETSFLSPWYAIWTARPTLAVKDESSPRTNSRSFRF